MSKAIPTNRLGLTALVLTALCAVIALATFKTGDSKAAFTGGYQSKCTGWHGFGTGAPSQTIAQRALSRFWRSHTSTTKTRGCGPDGWQRVFFRPVNTPDGGLPQGNSSFGTRSHARYLALDAPPTVDQRESAESAASAHGPARLVTVPAAQSALVIAVNFPKNCELRAGDADLAPYARFQVSNERLVAAFLGGDANDQWGELLPGIKAIPGTPRSDHSCRNQRIIRVAPEDVTPRSKHFKRFLHRVNPRGGWHARHSGRNWPNPHSGLRGVGSTLQMKLAKVTSKTDGAITFLDLAAARIGGFQKQSDPHHPGGAYVYDDSNRPRSYHAGGKRFTFRKTRFWIPLEVADGAGASGSGRFAEPTISRISIVNGRKGANCRDMIYENVPMAPSGKPDPYGDWSDVHSQFAPERYPLCAMGYVAFWKDPADVYGNSRREQAKARTLKDFMTTSFYSGQNILYANDHAPVPAHATQDLRFASRLAITEMGWDLP